ncbi:hypothetical protein DENSPDRAFT_886961 [Dentipellis sp. KUC8613]|nr:hypothetical protein DENSPDRAFT_886961 [Dentipellis sp. KUC8613]
MYDFYLSVQHRTDGMGLNKPASRYRQFSIAIREWQCLQMLKRAGRAHYPDGINTMPPGGLAVECPACPRPDWNLPADWEQRPEGAQWLYEESVSMDACFKPKLKAHGLQDLELMPGWLYFVEDEKYHTFIGTHVEEQERGSCDSQFAAILKAKTLRTHGYSVSGPIRKKPKLGSS